MKKIFAICACALFASCSSSHTNRPPTIEELMSRAHPDDVYMSHPHPLTHADSLARKARVAAFWGNSK